MPWTLVDANGKPVVWPTRTVMRRATAATRAGECPGYVTVGVYMQTVYCDRGAHHERHGTPGSERHQAMTLRGIINW